MLSDCKNSINVHEHQNDWEKRKNMGNKIREKDKEGFKEEKQRKQLNNHCNCFNQNIQNEDYKIRSEMNYEKKNTKTFQDCKSSWNSFYANWSNNKDKKTHIFEDVKNNQDLNSDKLVAETISELKKKVEFLFKIFKDYNPKAFSQSYNEQSHGDYTGIMSGDVWHLFNINKRLNLAEKGIQKLTFILEDLLQETNKRKTSSYTKNLMFDEPLNFEDMTVTQRINFLKSRYDFIYNFMINFLKVHSVKELYSTLDLMKRDYESIENPLNPAFHFLEVNQSNNFNREDVMETLKDLKTQASEENSKSFQNCREDYSTRSEKSGENETKCYRNKLEVISEQAELAFFYDNEHGDSNEFRRKSNRHLRKKLSEVKQESVGNDSGISETTARLLAQEAMLKSSLDKTQFEIFSNHDSSEKNSSPGKNHQLNLDIESPLEEENNEKDTEISLDSSSCTPWETGNAEKSKVSNTGKYYIHEEYKKEVKQERNLEPLPNTLLKTNTISRKNTYKCSDAKNQSPYKVLHQKKPTLLASSVRAQNGCYLPEICFFSGEETKKELGAKNQRPLTTPGSYKKAFQTSEVKALIPEKNRKKYSEINNVKYKNKLLLSQKSCVRTA